MNAKRVTSRALSDLAGEFVGGSSVRGVSAGKAAVGMAGALDEALGARLIAGVMTARVGGNRDLSSPWRTFAAGHPYPTPESEAAGRAALREAELAARDEATLVVCLSGGASAMLAVPPPGVTIEDKAAATAVLMRAGLDIAELNLVRRHMSRIKGGRLAAAAGRSITLAISDVCTPVEDDPLVIGSGPTVGDDTVPADALAILERTHLVGQLPASVVAHLRSSAALGSEAQVRPADPRLRQAAYWVVASRHTAMRAAADTARRLGYGVRVIGEPTVGNAADAFRSLAEALRTVPRPACVIASGETTVRVTGGGRGGRNQQLALGALRAIADLHLSALASIGTDGVDGPTDAAGAIVDSSMWGRLGTAAGDVVADALARCDAYPLLDALGALVRTGPTGTNVGDLQVWLKYGV